MGSDRGILLFNAARHLDETMTVFPLRAVAFEVDGRPIDQKYMGGRTIQHADRVTLPYDKNGFTIGVASLDYLLSDQIQYAYRLEGFDREWRYTTGNRRYVSYSNVREGNYRFVARATTRAGTWGDHVMEIGIRIEPPLYRSVMAWVFYIVLILSAIWFVRRFAARNAARRNEKSIYAARIDFFSRMGYGNPAETSSVEEGSSEGERSGLSGTEDKFLRKAVAILEKNYTNPQFNVPQFAREMGLSRTSLHVKLKALTGVTPNTMLRDLRLLKSTRLLAENEMNIEEVCYAVGFNTPSYFTKCFYALYGMLPNEYKSSGKQSLH